MKDLGTLGSPYSQAVAVDGNIVVGWSSSENGPEHAFAYDLGAPTPVMRDLGSLVPGGMSTATAVDGNIVVGYAGTTAAGDIKHAFAYDLGAANPTMRDLGSLGRDSGATAVDGNLVVGSFRTAGWNDRAFVYDLGAAAPRMRGLGTLGGSSSSAVGVSGNIVVGNSETAASNGYEHAFAYDLAAPAPKMKDLGTLGGTDAGAVGIDGNIVAGTSAIRRDFPYHAFAYDLGAAAPTMRDLGSISGNLSEAMAVSGNVVVGDSGWSAKAFFYDLGAAAPRMRSPGTLGGDLTEANAVDGTIVSGDAHRIGDGAPRMFAYDLGATTPELTDLGPAGGEEGPAGVSGNVIAGDIRVGDSPHAAVWTLERTTAPSIRFSALRTRVMEDSRRVSITVARAGDPTPAVGIHYVARGLSARAGKDFTAVSGTLSFAAGQTEQSLSVPILNDSVTERPENIFLVLSAPTGGAVRGTPNAAVIAIRASDQRPDALISTREASGYVGNNIYNTTGLGQTTSLSAHRTQTRSFYVRVQNDGNSRNTFSLRGSRARLGSTVRYYSGTTDVTAAMVSSSGWPVTLRAGTSRLVKVRIRLLPAAAVGARMPATVKVTWTGDVTRIDLARAVVHAVR